MFPYHLQDAVGIALYTGLSSISRASIHVGIVISNFALTHQLTQTSLLA
jgi:hypothetical protein